jgi:hypothetical protein
MANTKYHLTLEDPDSGMTLAYKTPGFIEVGLTSQNVEFSLPFHFLKTFLKAIGNESLNSSALLPGSSTLAPNPVMGASGISSIFLDPPTRIPGSEFPKIQCIKDVRSAFQDTVGYSLGLKEAKDAVELAMRGTQAFILSGTHAACLDMQSGLKNLGWDSSIVPATSP